MSHDNGSYKKAESTKKIIAANRDHITGQEYRTKLYCSEPVSYNPESTPPTDYTLESPETLPSCRTHDTQPSYTP